MLKTNDGNFWDQLMGDDEGASTYMLSYGEGPGSATRYLVGKFINDGESVLDVGCGPGHNLDHFMKYGPQISGYRGVDYSERFVRVANERAMQIAGTSSGPFVFGDARHLDEPDNSWDVVLLQDVLDHTPGYEEPMKEALRIARKRIIVVFWRGHMMDEYQDRGEDMIRDDGNDGWTGEYSRSKWEAYLDSLGYMWLDTQTAPTANRWHRYYIIDKEELK